MRTKGEAVAAARRAIANYTGQADELRAEHDKIRADQRRVQEELTATIDQLVTGLLPSHEPDVVAAAARETGAGHLTGRLDALAHQLAESRQRVDAIRDDDRYRRRDALLAPGSGEITRGLAEVERAIAELEERRDGIASEEFLWLYNRDVHRAPERTGLQKFLRAVTLQSHREKRALKAVREQSGDREFAAVAGDYDDVCEQLATHEERRRELAARKQELVALFEEHAELAGWIDDYPQQCVVALRLDLASHLERCDFAELHRQVRPAAQPLAGKCHALGNKLIYLGRLADHLDAEIGDRTERIRSIDKVQRVWARKPYGHLRGDKSKWLVTIPEMKRKSTRKRVGWVRTTHHNIVHYDDYDDYSALLDGTPGFLAYDAFAWGAEERMPYEGFTRSVIPELAEYREECGQDRVDYSAFDECIAGAETISDADDEPAFGEEDEAAAAGALAEEAELDDGGDPADAS